MSWIIKRTNGSVTQCWDSNEASWEFFLGGMSKDVQWHKDGDPYHRPWKFKDFDEAKWYLDTRRKRLGTLKRREEADWTYHIEEVTE